MIRSVANAYRQAYSNLPPQIWMLAAALFVNRFGTMVLPFLTLYLTQQLNYSESEASLMISVYGLGAVFGTYFSGRMTRILGAVRLQIVLLLASVPLFLLLPYCRSWHEFSAVILCLSFVSEGVRPANAVAITEFSTPAQRNRSFALQRMALNLGLSFGPAIGGLLIAIDFHWIFVVDAATTLLCALVLFAFFGWRQLPSERPIPESNAPPRQPIAPYQDREYLMFLGLILASAIVFFQFRATYPLYLRDQYGMTPLEIGLIYAVNTVIVVIFEMLIVESLRHWKRVLAIGWGCCLTCIGFGILPFSSAWPICVLSMVVLTIGEMLSMPLASGWVSDRSERGDIGAYMGWYTTAFALAFIIGPAVGGLIYQQNRDLVFHLATAIGVLVLIGFLWLNRRLERGG